MVSFDLGELMRQTDAVRANFRLLIIQIHSPQIKGKTKRSLCRTELTAWSCWALVNPTNLQEVSYNRIHKHV